MPEVPWWERAACLGMAPLFDAVESWKQGRSDRRQVKAIADRLEAAAKVCERCPVRAECDADWKVGRDEGVRAGKVLPPIFSQPKRRQQVAS